MKFLIQLLDAGGLNHYISNNGILFTQLGADTAGNGFPGMDTDSQPGSGQAIFHHGLLRLVDDIDGCLYCELAIIAVREWRTVSGHKSVAHKLIDDAVMSIDN